jgi:hypothetical protein
VKLLCEKERQLQDSLNILQHRPRNLRRKGVWTSRPLASNAAQGKDVCPLIVCIVFVRYCVDKEFVMDRPIIQIALQIT